MMRAAVEVAFARRGRADVHGLIRGAHVARVRIGIREHRDRAYAQAARGAEDAAGDLAAIGHQD